VLRQGVAQRRDQRGLDGCEIEDDRREQWLSRRGGQAFCGEDALVKACWSMK
jgi:hypothetical protein